jgi:hypothetical protein
MAARYKARYGWAYLSAYGVLHSRMRDEVEEDGPREPANSVTELITELIKEEGKEGLEGKTVQELINQATELGLIISCREYGIYTNNDQALTYVCASLLSALPAYGFRIEENIKDLKLSRIVELVETFEPPPEYVMRRVPARDDNKILQAM